MLKKLQTLNWVNIVFILIGLKAIIQADVALALIAVCYSALIGFRDYLKTKEIKPLDEEVKKRLDEMQVAVAGISLKNASKPQNMEQELKNRRFF